MNLTPRDVPLFTGIPVLESKWLRAGTWGYYLEGTIVTPDAARLARNLDRLGISMSTGKIDMLPGMTERDP